MQQKIQSIIDPQQLGEVKASIAVIGGTATILTLNEWVAVATLIYVIAQIGLLIPRYIKICSEWNQNPKTKGIRKC